MQFSRFRRTAPLVLGATLAGWFSLGSLTPSVAYAYSASCSRHENYVKVWYKTWVNGRWVTDYSPPHLAAVWHPGYYSTVSHPGYSTSVWHPAYTTKVWHNGYDSTVTHPGYSTTTTHTIAGHWQSVWHPATTSTIDEPQTTPGYWKTVHYTVPVQEVTWHTETVTQTYQIPVQKTVHGWHTVTQVVWQDVGSSQASGSAGTTYAIALPSWLQAWGYNPTAEQPGTGQGSGSGGGSTGSGHWEPVEETTRVDSAYQTTVMETASRQVTTQVPETVTTTRTEPSHIWVA
ncbi:MAG: hypothetical protein C7B46_17110, partial [Sulfobacillus benefaciens]